MPTNPLRPRLLQSVKTFLTLTMAGGLSGFLISYLFAAQYTSLALVRGPTLLDPEIFTRFTTADAVQGLEATRQRAFTDERLESMVVHLGLARAGEEGNIAKAIRQKVGLKPAIVGTANKDALLPSDFLGFYVIYSDSSAGRAQQICGGLTSVLLQGYELQRATQAQSTIEFLQHQIDDVKMDIETTRTDLLKLRKERMRHVAGSEPQYLKLAREYKEQQSLYASLLEKRTRSELAITAESHREVDFLSVIRPASLPTRPDFPNRSLFSAGGTVAGLLVWAVSLLDPTRRSRLPAFPH